jgi:hypothetical protein
LVGDLNRGAFLRLLDAAGDRAEGDPGQDGNDPNDHKEFDEGETASICARGTTKVEAVVLHDQKVFYSSDDVNSCNGTFTPFREL